MKFFFLLSFCSIFFLQGEQKNISKEEIEQNKVSAVTYVQQGRLGDQFLGYLHAKWVSYLYGIPLLYKPFEYSDKLVLHKEELHFDEVDISSLPSIFPSCNNQVSFEKEIGALYVIPYFPESKWELETGNNWYSFQVNWKDEEFRKELKRLIRPIEPITPFLDLPKDRISVAVHIRKGGGFDPADLWKYHPLKFPPDNYYIEQIKNIYKIVQRPLYVYLFTDEPNPLDLVQKYKRHLRKLDIEWDCRSSGNHHAANVLEDLFEMTRFDCLIRPDSNFSIVASKIGDYKVVISPRNYIQTGNNMDTIRIHKVEIDISTEFDRNSKN